jgi:hypothetical protein
MPEPTMATRGRGVVPPTVGREGSVYIPQAHLEIQNTAKRPGTKKGGREEEESRPGVAIWP